MIKIPPANAGEASLAPGLGRSLGEGDGHLLQDWEILWTEEPGELQSMGLQRIGHE